MVLLENAKKRVQFWRIVATSPVRSTHIRTRKNDRVGLLARGAVTELPVLRIPHTASHEACATVLRMTRMAAQRSLRKSVHVLDHFLCSPQIAPGVVAQELDR